jgi:hypothetical protein
MTMSESDSPTETDTDGRTRRVAGRRIAFAVAAVVAIGAIAAIGVAANNDRKGEEGCVSDCSDLGGVIVP